jgi:hypothetical protein
MAGPAHGANKAQHTRHSLQSRQTEQQRPEPEGPETQDPFRSETEVGLFPTFFMAGFECSTFVWKDGQRKDYVALTGHDRHLEADYDRVEALGIGVVREAIRWPLVDQGRGRYDWSTVEPFVAALETHHLRAIWDLCHYGFPDGFDPFADADQRRYVDYCRAATEYVVARTAGPRYFTPLN